MKITKLILENFAAIKKSMNTNRFEIDFQNSKNNVCLIIGPNGSGKTTIMSLLNPFATLGNLDIRDSLGLILEDKNGYKEIHYQNNDDYYVIKHFYTKQKDRSHSVKSYIEKNGNELNPNGNVTSFKEIVKEELDVELDYLKLIRLGANVTNMIDLSETERKNYMGKLLDDIGIYLNYYKKVNNDIRQLKDMISHLVDKINKLNIDSKESVEKEIDSYISQKEKIQSEIYSIVGKLSVLKARITEINDLENLKTNLSESQRLLNKMTKVLNSSNTYQDTDLDKINTKIQEMQMDIQKYTTNSESCIVIIKHLNETLDNLLNQYHELEICLEQEKNIQDEIDTLESEKRSCDDDIAFANQELAGFELTVKKEEFEKFVVFLKNSQEMINTAYEYGKKPIRKVVSLLEKNKNVNNYILNNSTSVSESDQLNLFIHKLKQLGIKESDFNDSLPCGEYKCKFKQLAIQVFNLTNSNEPDKDSSPEFTHDVEMVWKILENVLNSFKEYKDLIVKLPISLKNDFMTENIFHKLTNLEPLFDTVKVNEYMSLLTEYEFRLKRIQDKESINEQINYRMKISNLSSIVTNMKSVKDQINSTEEAINTYRNTILDNNELIDQLKKELESMTDWYESCTKYDEVEKRHSSLLKDLEVYQTSKTQINEFEAILSKDNRMVQDLERIIETKKANLLYYTDYAKELKKYTRIYDDMVFVKDALSSKKGIPLHYMSLYLGNTEEITNELLDIAYDGEIYIDKFNITPTEFTIPFYNHGTLIRDVKYASQGELSFLSIALSFALATQAMSKYNIMLLDEIDGPLDKSNRVKFINVLENQIDRISSEQNFLITHNDMFSGYPVDIIDLSFSEKSDQYPLATFISLKK